MNQLKIFLFQSWRFLLSPREQITLVASNGRSSYLSSIIRGSVPILLCYFLSTFSIQKIGLQYLLAGGSLSKFLFRALVPDFLIGTFSAGILGILFLSGVSAVLYWAGKSFQGRADWELSLELTGRLSVAFLLLGVVNALGIRSAFGRILYLSFFLYFSYVSILVFFYGIQASQKISVIFGLAIGICVYVFLLFGARNEMQNFTIPTQSEIITPEEEQERIREAEDTIRKLEEARRERGIKN